MYKDGEQVDKCVYFLETINGYSYEARIEMPSKVIPLCTFSAKNMAINAVRLFTREFKAILFSPKFGTNDTVYINLYKRGSKTIAKIKYLGVSLYFGSYDDKDTAHEAANEAKLEIETFQDEWGEPMTDIKDLSTRIKAKYSQPQFDDFT